jgi:hypothetical protein
MITASSARVLFSDVYADPITARVLVAITMPSQRIRINSARKCATNVRL